MRRFIIAVAALLLTTPSLSACSGGASGSGDGPTTIHITIKNGKVTPDGDRVKASVDKPITLKIHADTAGEIHVHSSPEQHIEFGRGTTTRKLVITKPGIIDVEDHALDQVIVQLQVS